MSLQECSSLCTLHAYQGLLQKKCMEMSASVVIGQGRRCRLWMVCLEILLGHFIMRLQSNVWIYSCCYSLIGHQYRRWNKTLAVKKLMFLGIRGSSGPSVPPPGWPIKENIWDRRQGKTTEKSERATQSSNLHNLQIMTGRSGSQGEGIS